MNEIINVTSPLLPDLDSYVEKLHIIWDKKWLTNNGEMCIALQNKLEERLRCKTELFVNGHMALDIAIKALHLTGEIITTPFTFASTTHAIVMNQCTPIFCDIKSDNYTIDEEQIERLITKNTSAILPVHVYGCVCNVEAIQRIADKYNLKVIYDAAHAFDVFVNGISIAEFGDLSMFSFHATKIFNTIEGGALAFHANEQLSHSVRNLRNFGIENAESVTQVGLNAKMNEFAAAMGICNLESLDQAILRRKEITEKYVACIQKISGIRTLDYRLMQMQGIRYNYAYMPIEVNPKVAGFSRDDLYEFLLKRNVVARKYFYPLVPDYECYKNRFQAGDLPVAKRVSNQILTLPLYATMTDEQVQWVCDSLLNISEKKN